MECMNCGKDYISSEFATPEMCSDCYFGTKSEVAEENE